MTTVPMGRRERKKAATRQKIADTALQLFLERGYEVVGIRDVAAEADVAVTTLFSHFGSKEALVFEQDADFAERLVRAVTDRTAGEPLVPALCREVLTLVRHCTAEGSAPVWRMIVESAALREYEESMRLRHAEALAAVLADQPGLARSPTACKALARFTIDAFALAREAADPAAAVGEIFRMIEAAWEAA
ncbi:TetR/AcrR family transcriptional regulator [Streptomyces sp. NPDC058459]|uniref:TetR/AcrR family transcriptional regulator n=1 Tax=Streptomyces sp. NPDC058459 TaxID=3346508 RepID=UPI00365DDBE5